jgi:hypothetical protein
VAADERHRVGRRRRLGSNAPPVWFGIPFAAGGLLTLVLGLTTGVEQGVPLVVTSAIGLLFSVVGVALIWTSLRARTAEAPKTRTNLGPDDVERFTRSPMRIFVDLVGAPIGGLAFLGVAIAILFTPAFLGSIVFGFFGILMLTGAAVTVRRGIGMTVATVGPGGIWTPELGQLPWTEIAELRIEDPTGIGGPNNGTTTTYRRLGIVPRTQELIENAPGRDAMSLARGFMSFVNTLKPGTGLSDPTALAPYGIQAYETEQPFADIIRSVQRFAPVAGAEVALGDGTRLVDGDGAAALVANPPALPAAPSLFEALAIPSPSFPATSVLAGTPFVPIELAPVTAAESRTFVRSGGPIGTGAIIRDIWMSLPWVVLPGVILVTVPAVMLLSPETQLNPGLFIAVAFLLMPLGFVAYGVLQILALPARWRMRTGEPQLLTVDAEGIDLRGMGHLAWNEIEDVRVVNSNRPTGEDEPSIPRLEIVPRDRSRLANRPLWDQRRDAWRSFLRRLNPFGDRSPVQPVFGIDLDLIDANPDEVIDLIARYRIVEDET